MGDDLPPPVSVGTNGDRVVLEVARDDTTVRVPLPPTAARSTASTLVHAASVVEDRRVEGGGSNAGTTSGP